MPHQHDVARIAERRADDGQAAEQHVRPQLGAGLAQHDHDNPGKRRGRAAYRARADLLVKEERSEHQGDERCDKSQRDGLRERDSADAPEEQEGHDRHDHAPGNMDSQRGAARPGESSREV